VKADAFEIVRLVDTHETQREWKGKVDAERAEQFLADHFDVVAGREEADARTLCGHVEDLPPGRSRPWPGEGTGKSFRLCRLPFSRQG